MREVIKRYAIVLAAWLPFFAIWVLFAMLYAHYPSARGTCHKHDFDGHCEPYRNRCLAYLPTLAMAPSSRPEVLFPSNLLCIRVLNSLDYFSLFSRVDAPWKQCFAGFPEFLPFSAGSF